MKERFFILLDCDGILSDFITAALKIVRLKTGKQFKHDDITQWDIFKSIGMPEMWKTLHEVANRKGWCAKLKPYPGAQEGVQRLKDMGEIYIVTSPLSTSYWCLERTQWCEKHFGLGKPNVIHTEAKHMVRGNVLVDDKPENVQAWKAVNPDGLAILWDANYNREPHHEAGGIVRVHGWDQLFAEIQRVKDGR